jgi:hypothetical protein
MQMNDLLIQFEKDIVYDAHNFRTKVRRSLAGKRIVAMGKRALPLIVEYLEKTSPDPEGQVSCGCTVLMGRIGVDCNLDVSALENLPYTNISAWIAWAKSIEQDHSLPVAR